MTHDQSHDSSPSHRFFHAMVLMGSSLALGCGGATSSSSAEDETNVGGATTGTSGSGGAPAGGATYGGASAGVAGAPNPTGGQSSVPPEPPSCPPAQWDCSRDPPICWGDAYGLPESCACDRQRPSTVADCGVGETFVCRAGRMATADGLAVNTVPFECSCVPSQETCTPICDDAYAPWGSCREAPVGDSQSVLCSCALIVLR